MKRQWKWFTAILLITVLLTDCKKKPKNDDENPDENNFDRPAMLINLGTNLIIPAYQEFQTNVDSLQNAVDSLLTNPNSNSLHSARNAFKAAYVAYQYISTFEIGPAETQLLRANCNTFPCDTTQLNGKIAAGDFDLSAVADIDVKGFPAIDFLLYGSKQNDAAVLYTFTSSPNSVNTKNYLSTLVKELNTKTDLVLNEWLASGGNYLSTFHNNSGTSVGSSVGFLVNQLNFDLELLKNAKIGIPAGKKSLGVLYPDKVEANYSALSLTLALAQLKNIENLYLGRSLKGTDDIGFDDYVISTKATHPDGPLNDVIKNKFVSAKTALSAIPETLSQSVTTNASLVDTAYLELQQLVVLLKVDMPSALGVTITYEDNDGD